MTYRHYYESKSGCRRLKKKKEGRENPIDLYNIWCNRCYLSVGVGQVELVADHDDGHVDRALGADDLVPDRGRLLERLGVGDRVDEHERVRGRNGQGPHGRELVRARRVQYVQVDFDAVHGEPAVVHFLHGPLVLGRELAIQKLGDQ